MVLVGAGGAGRAVAFALMDLGVAILVILTATVHVRMRSTMILCAIMAHPAAESRANLSGISRLRREWSTRHRWACAAFPAIRYQYLRSKRRIGLLTSFIRRSKRGSSKPLSPRGPACSTAAGCACTKRSKHSGFLPVSSPTSPACVARSPRRSQRRTNRRSKLVDAVFRRSK